MRDSEGGLTRRTPVGHSYRTRPGARVLLLDEADRVLLFLTRDRLGRWPSFWMTPGGGLEPGESFEEGARRELIEETGISDVELGLCVWQRDCVSWYSGSPVHIVEEYFVGRTATSDIDRSGHTEYELRDLTEARWWAIGDILASAEDFQPRGLGGLLRELLVGDAPAEPLALEL